LEDSPFTSCGFFSDNPQALKSKAVALSNHDAVAVAIELFVSQPIGKANGLTLS
jgi:hypothetical protein